MVAPVYVEIKVLHKRERPGDIESTVVSHPWFAAMARHWTLLEVLVIFLSLENDGVSWPI